MKIEANSVTDYLTKIPSDRQEVVGNLLALCREHLSSDFEEGIHYGMIGFVVSFEKFPQGYHCNPKQALPFITIASQKNFVAFYHMGLYADTKLFDWFVAEYPKHSKHKLDMGKSCIRFKWMDDVPYKLIEELVKRMNADRWIQLYLKR